MKAQARFAIILLLLVGSTRGIAAMETYQPQNFGFENPDINALMENSAISSPGMASPESEILRVKQNHEQTLLAINGVVGVGIQRNQIGDEEIVVYLRDVSVQKHIPDRLEGFPVKTQVIGEIDAY